MAEDQKKTPLTEATGVPQTSPPVQSQSQKATPAKGPLISRRAFLIEAVGASTLLTLASMGSSGAILGPLIPTPEQPTVIGTASGLESKYQAAIGAGTVTSPSVFDNPNTNFSSFFYWPYDVSVSPYYKNIIVRLPDDKYLQQPTSETWNGQTYSSSLYPVPGSSTGARFVAFNTTCVHLRCLVNPGYAESQFRLQCPCHGSQYNLADAVPVRGPAFDLALNPLPKVELSIDASGNITATNLNGQPGIGRTTQ